MTESFRFEILENPDYYTIAEVIGDNPKQYRWKTHPDWGEALLKFHAPDKNLYVGAFEGNKLIGCMVAHPDKLKIRGEILNCAVIAITEVLMDYRKNGIATKMIEKMVSQIIKQGYEMALAFQTAGRGGKGILKNADFQKVHKYGHAGKVLDKRKVDDYWDLNPVLKKVALSLVNTDIGEINPSKGIVREAKEEDLDQIVELMNAEGEKLDISSYWTKDYLKKNLDWRYVAYVLEDKGEIIGTVIRYEELVNMGREDFTVGFLKELSFKEHVEENDRITFIFNILQRIKDDKIPNVSFPTPKPVMNVLKGVGFRTLPGDERTLFIKPFSDEAKELVEQVYKFKTVDVFLIC